MQYSLNILLTLTLVTFATIKAAPIPEAVVIQPVQQQIIQPQPQVEQNPQGMQAGLVRGSVKVTTQLVNGTLNLITSPIKTTEGFVKGVYGAVRHPLDTASAIEKRAERCFDNSTEAGDCIAQTVGNVALGYAGGAGIQKLAVAGEAKALAIAPKAVRWRNAETAAGEVGAAGAAVDGGKGAIEASEAGEVTGGAAGDVVNDAHAKLEGPPTGEGSTVPKPEGNPPPAEGGRAPKDVQTATPAQGEAPPAKDVQTATPAQGEAPPAKDVQTATPAQGEAPPAKDVQTATPAQGEAPPSMDGTAAPRTMRNRIADTASGVQTSVKNGATAVSDAVKNTAAKVPIPQSVKNAGTAVGNAATPANAASVGLVGSTVDLVGNNSDRANQ